MSTDEVGVPEEVEEYEPKVTQLYNHCQLIYTNMEMSAKKAAEGLVWEGQLTRLFEDVGLGQPYYTSVTRKLRAMGCLKQLHRGGGSRPSLWLLVAEPNPEMFMRSPDREAGGRTNTNSSWPMQKQIHDLSARLLKAEDRIEFLRRKLL